MVRKSAGLMLDVAAFTEPVESSHLPHVTVYTCTFVPSLFAGYFRLCLSSVLLYMVRMRLHSTQTVNVWLMSEVFVLVHCGTDMLVHCTSSYILIAFLVPMAYCSVIIMATNYRWWSCSWGIPWRKATLCLTSREAMPQVHDVDFLDVWSKVAGPRDLQVGCVGQRTHPGCSHPGYIDPPGLELVVGVE